jgi:hypothetical protein
MSREVASTGIDWESVRRDLDSESWEDDPYNRGSQTRRTFLGTVFALYPSGKHYVPFACSNLDPCPVCQGSSQIQTHPSARIRKRAKKRAERLRARFRRRLASRPRKYDPVIRKRWIPAGPCASVPLGWGKFRQLQKADRIANGVPCPRCDGLGSHEAADDEAFRERLEAEAEEHGLYIDSGEGDPCDILAVECREAPDDEESDWDEDESGD